jgi:hypothetical protein
LNPGSAFLLPVIEALTVKTQILVPVAHHCRYFVFRVFLVLPSSVFRMGTLCGPATILFSKVETFYSLFQFSCVNMVREWDSIEIAVHQYEEHVLLVSSQIYY